MQGCQQQESYKWPNDDTTRVCWLFHNDEYVQLTVQISIVDIRTFGRISSSSPKVIDKIILIFSCNANGSYIFCRIIVNVVLLFVAAEHALEFEKETGPVSIKLLCPDFPFEWYMIHVVG